MKVWLTAAIAAALAIGGVIVVAYLLAALLDHGVLLDVFGVGVALAGFAVLVGAIHDLLEERKVKR